MDCQSRLLIFVSVDIIGSTAYKNQPYPKREGVHPWLQHFTEFPELMREYLNQSPSLRDEALKVWKSLGDELVYTRELRHVNDASDLIGAFISAIARYNEYFRFKKAPLGVKGTAWLAGFPVINAKLDFKNKDGRKIIDYLGPSIDAGFRITKLASRSQFPISVELAWLLAKSNTQAIHFGGLTDTLKGLYGGRPYPRFWIKVRDPDQTLIDQMQANANAPANPDVVMQYCESYISSVQDSLVITRPYIAGQDIEGTSIPDRHIKIIEQLRNESQAADTEPKSEDQKKAPEDIDPQMNPG